MRAQETRVPQREGDLIGGRNADLNPSAQCIMKLLEILKSALKTGVLCALAVPLVACDPVETPRVREEMPVSGYSTGPGSDKTMDHNGEVSGNSDPARRQ